MNQKKPDFVQTLQYSENTKLLLNYQELSTKLRTGYKNVKCPCKTGNEIILG